MENNLFNKIDQFSNDFDVQLSQIVMKIFWVGYLAGKKQLSDDYDSSEKPLNSAVSELQDKLIELNGEGYDLQHMLSQEMNNLKKSKNQYSNLTQNHKKINKQHDIIVKDILDKLEKEMKSVKESIISKTKNMGYK